MKGRILSFSKQPVGLTSDRGTNKSNADSQGTQASVFFIDVRIDNLNFWHTRETDSAQNQEHQVGHMDQNERLEEHPCLEEPIKIINQAAPPEQRKSERERERSE